MATTPTAQPEAPAPKPGEVTVDLSKLEDEDSAAEQLAGLFDPALAADETEEASEPQGATAPEAPSSETNETDTSEPPPAAITAPVSWTAEEKAEFAKLPPQVQQTLLRRESDRDRGIQDRLREAADQRAKYETLQQQAAQAQAQQAQFLQSVVFQLQPELQRFQNIDWARLARENPAEWASQRQAFDDIQGRMMMAQQHHQAIQQQQQAQAEQQRREFLAAEQQKLFTKLPEAADPVKGRALAQDINDYLGKFGYSPQEISQNLTDHRAILIVRAAMMAEKAEAAKAAAQAKRVPAAQPGSNVRTLRPAARQGGNDGQARELGALHDNLVRTGSDSAAVDLMVGLGLFDKK